MARFKTRGRYEIVVPLATGGQIRYASSPSRSLTPREIVFALRKCACEIETWFGGSGETVVVKPSVKAVKP